MYDAAENKFVPVPQDRDLTEYEKKLTKFEIGERIFVKGMSFTVEDILERSIILAPVFNPMAASREPKPAK